MDPPQSSRPQGEQVEPGATRTHPPALPPPPQNPGDNAEAVNANPPADWQQMFHEMRSVILRQEEELQRLRQQAVPANQGLPPAPVPVVGNQGYVMSHRDSVFEQFVKLQPPVFLGGIDIIKADQWMSTVTHILDNMGVTGTERVNCAAFMFQDHARVWWDIVNQTRDVSVMTWDEFKKLFEEKFYNVAVRTSHQEDFVKLTQGKMSVAEYTLEFDRLSKFAGDLVPTDFTRKQKYVRGLNATISRDLKITTSHDTLYKRVVDLALIAEEAEQQVMKEQAAKDTAMASNPPAGGNVSKGIDSSNPEHKRKAEASGASGGNRKFRGNRGGRQGRGSSFRSYPECPKCKKHHPGEC
ncbi:hypothetical protein CsatA_010117 [Cannabis sativa]